MPASAGTTYYNEAANFFNAGKLDEAASAADKAIATDPKRADAYYIKGQALIPKATLDAKTNKFVRPPGCLEAYQQYLELDSDGPHAAEVKELLANLGQPVKNSFKAGKKVNTGTGKRALGGDAQGLFRGGGNGIGWAACGL